jgi:hypothetical protein
MGSVWKRQCGFQWNQFVWKCVIYVEITVRRGGSSFFITASGCSSGIISAYALINYLTGNPTVSDMRHVFSYPKDSRGCQLHICYPSYLFELNWNCGEVIEYGI